MAQRASHAGVMDITLFPQTRDGYQAFDMALDNAALASGGDLRNAVILSLFCDRRAEDDDALPDNTGSRRGWWGDTVTGRRIGSRLWLLSREKRLREVVNRAREYAQEAVAWLVDDSVVDDIEVEAAIVAAGVLGLAVRVFRPGAAPETYRFGYLWQDATLQGIAA